MGVILSKTTNYDLKEAPAEARIPTMYFQTQPNFFVNTRIFLPPELQYQPVKKTGITMKMVNAERESKRTKKAQKVVPEACGPLGNDVKVKFHSCFI